MAVDLTAQQQQNPTYDYASLSAMRSGEASGRISVLLNEMPCLALQQAQRRGVLGLAIKVGFVWLWANERSVATRQGAPRIVRSVRRSYKSRRVGLSSLRQQGLRESRSSFSRDARGQQCGHDEKIQAGKRRPIGALETLGSRRARNPSRRQASQQDSAAVRRFSNSDSLCAREKSLEARSLTASLKGGSR